MRLFLFFLLSCLFSVVRPYQVTLHAKSKSNNTISSSVILLLLFYFYFFVMGLVYWLVEISTVTLPELKCQPFRRPLLGLGSVAGQTFQTIFHVAWSLPIVCDNYRYIYNKLHIHSRKCDCFFPLEIMFCSSYLVSCQGRAPQGPTYRVIYLCPFDHLRTLKMRFLRKN